MPSFRSYKCLYIQKKKKKLGITYAGILWYWVRIFWYRSILTLTTLIKYFSSALSKNININCFKWNHFFFFRYADFAPTNAINFYACFKFRMQNCQFIYLTFYVKFSKCVCLKFFPSLSLTIKLSNFLRIEYYLVKLYRVVTRFCDV